MSGDSGFKWACYVSYRHGQGDLLKDFINELSIALENRLGLMGLGLKVFVDRDRLNPFYSITPGLAEAICRSVCMVVVYNNGYFDKNNPYCAKEFSTMVQLEKERLRANGIGPKFSLIIPVLLRRTEHMPDEIYSRNPVDFSEIYINPGKREKFFHLKNKLNQTMLETAYPNELNKIASTIIETYTLLSKLDKDLFARCNDAIFQSDEKVIQLLEKTSYKPVFPLSKSVVKTVLPSNVADLIDDADNAFDKAEYNSAIRLYQRILKLDPENLRAKKNLVEAEKRWGPGDVGKSLPQIAKQNLDQARLHISVRSMEQAISLLKGAINEAQKSGMKYPDAERMLGDAENMLLADGFRQLAIIVLQKESWEIALSYYKKALLLDPTNIIIKMELERLQNSIFNDKKNPKITEKQNNLMQTSKIKTPKVFVSYSHRDEKYKDELVKMLTPLKDQKILDIWQDREIQPGDEWYESIQNAMNTCDLALLLISGDFLASRFIRDEELLRLFQRRKEEGLRVVPVIVSDCLWASVPTLKDLQALPKNGKPVISFVGTGRRNQIWAEVGREIEIIARNI